jgi:hypothetical protein
MQIIPFRPAVLLSLILVAACSTAQPNAATRGADADETAGVLTCPGDHTPVVGQTRHEALGCNPAKDNKVAPGSDCSAFRAGARTTDVTGATYECGAAPAGLVWTRTKYAEPTADPNVRCAHVGDFARAPDGSLMRCTWNNSDLPSNGASGRP